MLSMFDDISVGLSDDSIATLQVGIRQDFAGQRRNFFFKADGWMTVVT